MDSLLREFRNLLDQVNFRNRSQFVAVNNAGLEHSLDRPERNLDRNMAADLIVATAAFLMVRFPVHGVRFTR